MSMLTARISNALRLRLALPASNWDLQEGAAVGNRDTSVQQQRRPSTNNRTSSSQTPPAARFPYPLLKCGQHSLSIARHQSDVPNYSATTLALHLGGSAAKPRDWTITFHGTLLVGRAFTPLPEHVYSTLQKNCLGLLKGLPRQERVCPVTDCCWGATCTLHFPSFTSGRPPTAAPKCSPRFHSLHRIETPDDFHPLRTTVNTQSHYVVPATHPKPTASIVSPPAALESRSLLQYPFEAPVAQPSLVWLLSHNTALVARV